jgi:hypothetical protein
MADPFDIRNYEKIGPGKGVIDADVLAEANRQRRLAQFGEAGIAQRAAAGQKFGAGLGVEDGLPSQRAATGSPNPPPRQTATPRAAAAPKAPPAPKAPAGVARRGLGVLGKFASKVALPVGAAVAAFDASQDTAEERKAWLRKLGLEEQNDAGQGTGYFSDSSRLVGGIARGLNSFALGVPEMVINKLQGRGFFGALEDEPVAPPVDASAVDTVGAGPESGMTAPAPVPLGRSQVEGAEEIAAANEFIDREAGSAPGTGFVRNNATGEITRLNFPTGGGRGVEATARRPIRLQGTGNATVDAAQELAFRMLPGKVARSNEARRAATLKAQADLVRAQTEANKPEFTTITEPLTGEPEIFQVRKGVARKLEPAQPIPAGMTPKTLVQSTLKAVADGDTTQAGALEALRKFEGFEGLPAGITIEDLAAQLDLL